MPSFKDTAEREWLITITVAHVRRVRDRLQINLADLQKGELLARLADAVTMVDVIFVLIEPQAVDRQITDEQFAAALGGDTLTTASDALLGALADFFPEPDRSLLRTIHREMQAMRSDATQKIQDSQEVIRRVMRGLKDKPAETPEVEVVAMTTTNPTTG